MALFEKPEDRIRRLNQTLLSSQARSEKLRSRAAEMSLDRQFRREEETARISALNPRQVRMPRHYVTPEEEQAQFVQGLEERSRLGAAETKDVLTPAIKTVLDEANRRVYEPIGLVGGRAFQAAGETNPLFPRGPVDTRKGREDVTRLPGDVRASGESIVGSDRAEVQERLREINPVARIAAETVFDPLNLVPGVGVTHVEDFARAGRALRESRPVTRIGENLATATEREGGMGGLLASERGGTQIADEIPPVKPPEPPTGLPEEAIPEPSWEEARDKALGALKSSRKVTAEQATKLSAERSKRIKDYRDLVAKNRAEGMAPREAERTARGALGGEVEKVPGLKVEFTEPETEALFRRINDFDYGTEPFMQPRASVAMEKLITQTPLQTNEIDVLRRVFGDEFGNALERAAKKGKAGWDEVFDLIVLPKTVLSSFDLSYPFRQGIMVAPRHPKEFFGNIPNMAKSFASEGVATRIDDAIKNDPARVLVKQADGTLAETSQGAINQNIGIIRPQATGSRSAAEEGFLSQLGLKLPGVKQSSRAFVTYGNKLRSDLASYWIRHWQNTGVDITPERLESLGNLLNRLTGRGTLGRGEAANRVTQLLQATWWSPQYRLSGPQAYAQLFNKDPAIRKIAAQNLAAFMGGGVGILGLLKATGAADVDVDPRSTDFGKIRVGNFRANFWGSQQLLARSIAQAVTQQKYDVGLGGVKPIAPGKVAIDYFRSGLAPEWSLIWDALQGENYIGQEFKLDADEALDRLAPIALQDTIEAYQAGGPLAAGATAPLSTLGLSTTTYPVDLSNQLQAIGQYRGIDPKLEDELQKKGGFYDRVDAYRKTVLDETGVKPTTALGILKVARDEGRDTDFIQTAVKLRPGSKTEVALRNPEWLKFIADHEKELMETRPDLVDPEQGAPDYIIRYLRFKRMRAK